MWFCSIFILFCTFTCMLVTDKIRIPMLVYSFVFKCSIYKRSKSYIYRNFMKSRLVDGLMDMLLTCTFADEGLQYHNLWSECTVCEEVGICVLLHIWLRSFFPSFEKKFQIHGKQSGTDDQVLQGKKSKYRTYQYLRVPFLFFIFWYFVERNGLNRMFI